MRARAEASPPPFAIGLSTSVVKREALRALVAFGLYLVLYPAWKFIGVPRLYQAVVLKIATAVVLATQHFPVVSTLEKLSVVHLDYLPILVLAYFLVSTGMAWGTRIRRYGALLVAILIVQVVGVILETGDDAAQHLLEQEGLVLLLPWEFRISDGFKYLLVDFGLNIGPFVVMLLGMAWNSGVGLPANRARPGTGRRLLWGGFAAILGLCLATLVWRELRESDPRHALTHARLGHLFLRSGQPAKAEAQYGIALKNGCTDGEAYVNLARIDAGNGRKEDALRLLETGLQIVPDAAWRKRLQEEWTRLARSR